VESEQSHDVNHLLERQSEGYLLPMHGASIDEVSFGGPVGISCGLATDDVPLEWTIVLADAFQLHLPDGTQHTLDPLGPPTKLSPLLDLLEVGPRETHITQAFVSDSGKLEISFEDGGGIVCEPHSDFEAFEIQGPHNLLVIGSPGGGALVAAPEQPLPHSQPDHVLPIHCAFCFREMQPEGERDPWDPTRIVAASDDRERSYVFDAHRVCVLRAFHPEFRDPDDDQIIAQYGEMA
jgi:hypothetical protein